METIFFTQMMLFNQNNEKLSKIQIQDLVTRLNHELNDAIDFIDDNEIMVGYETASCLIPEVNRLLLNDVSFTENVSTISIEDTPVTQSNRCSTRIDFEQTSSQNNSIIENGIVKHEVKEHLESIFIYKLRNLARPTFISVPPKYDYIPETLTINSTNSGKKEKLIGVAVTSVSSHEVI
jgi:hypothetical protein